MQGNLNDVSISGNLVPFKHKQKCKDTVYKKNSSKDDNPNHTEYAFNILDGHKHGN